MWKKTAVFSQHLFFFIFNPVALRTAKTPKCFGLSECSRVNLEKAKYMYVNAPMSRHVVIKYWDMGRQYKQVL